MKRWLALGFFLFAVLAAVLVIGFTDSNRVQADPPGGTGALNAAMEWYYHRQSDTVWDPGTHHYLTHHVVYSIISFTGNTSTAYYAYNGAQEILLEDTGGPDQWYDTPTDSSNDSSGFLHTTYEDDAPCDAEGDGWAIYEELSIWTNAKKGANGTPVAFTSEVLAPHFSAWAPSPYLDVDNVAHLSTNNGYARMEFESIRYLFNKTLDTPSAYLEMQWKSANGTWKKATNDYYTSSTGVSCKFLPDSDVGILWNEDGWVHKADCLVPTNDLYSQGYVTVRMVMRDGNDDYIDYWPSSDGYTLAL